ncbi:MAG: thiamine phosphate synthase [Marinifilaceae bacterium]|nr:thiamine phosphate synthase [Marinifilaceae bacterium]
MSQVQFITHFTDKISYLDSVSIALEGGCRWIQLRMKNSDDTTLLNTAREVRRLCDQYNATFIIDDNIQAVIDAGADGVHLGKGDMPIAEARRVLGRDRVIGGTANTFNDVVMHYDSGADYIGCGPFRFTTTKSNLSPILGIDGYSEIIKQMRERGISIPLVAIGGITKDDIPGLLETGVSGVALSGAILNAENPVDEMRDIITQCNEYK